MTASPAEDVIELVYIGKILKAHGLNGALIVRPYSKFPSNLTPGKEVLIIRDGLEKVFTIISVQSVKNNLRIVLDTVKTRNIAEELIGSEVGIRQQDLVELQEDDFYVFDLVGCRVVDNDGEQIGKVEDVINNPGHDLLRIDKDGNSVLIPMVKEFVKEINLNKKEIKVVLIEGFID